MLDTDLQLCYIVLSKNSFETGEKKFISHKKLFSFLRYSNFRILEKNLYLYRIKHNFHWKFNFFVLAYYIGYVLEKLWSHECQN